MMVPIIGLAQKKENGTIYREHPSIAVFENYTKAIATGDTNKIGSFLADNFVAYDASSAGPFDKGLNKSAFLKRMKTWRDGIDYFSLKTSNGAYPDALQYKDTAQKDVVWIQAWDDLKGVNKKTGVKMDMPLHRLATINKNNKIEKLFIYDNAAVYDEINASMSERKNGTIYNHHQYINDVRNMLHAFAHSDLTKAHSYYADNAVFLDINHMDRDPNTFDQQKKEDQGVLDAYEVVDLEQVGYPDYMHYEISNSDVVYSWWTWHLIRKSDKKEITLPMHYEHDFNKDGKIFREIVYYNHASL